LNRGLYTADDDIGQGEDLRNIVTGVAWGLIPVPAQDHSFFYAPVNIHRTVVLKACQVYAFTKGYRILMDNTIRRVNTIWEIEATGDKSTPISYRYRGSPQQVCLRLLELTGG
jgi:hypothetical protein